MHIRLPLSDQTSRHSQAGFVQLDRALILRSRSLLSNTGPDLRHSAANSQVRETAASEQGPLYQFLSYQTLHRQQALAAARHVNCSAGQQLLYMSDQPAQPGWPSLVQLDPLSALVEAVCHGAGQVHALCPVRPEPGEEDNISRLQHGLHTACCGERVCSTLTAVRCTSMRRSAAQFHALHPTGPEPRGQEDVAGLSAACTQHACSANASQPASKTYRGGQACSASSAPRKEDTSLGCSTACTQHAVACAAWQWCLVTE